MQSLVPRSFRVDIQRFKRSALCVAVASMFMIGHVAASGQATIKLGIVDIDSVVSMLPEATQFEESIVRLRQSYIDTLTFMQQQIEQRAQKYQNEMSMMPAETRKQEEANLDRMYQGYRKYAEDHLGETGTVARRQSEVMEPLRAKVLGAIQAVTSSMGLNMVIDKSVALYYEDRLDITGRVIASLKSGVK